MSPKKRNPGDPVVIATQTVTRRTVVEWLGKATVLTMGGNFFTNCIDVNQAQIDGGIPGDTSFFGDGGNVISSCPEDTPFDFAQGEGVHPIFQNWKENTVDPQDLAKILSGWRLSVDGLVNSAKLFSFFELAGLPRHDQITDFHCVEGWSVYEIPWNGVHIKDLMNIVSPLSSATHITFHTLGDIYNESLPLDVALESKTLLAYGVNCATLPLKHGFPIRLVVPRKLGYKNAKYLYRIEFTDQPENGYWEKWGYPYDADVPPDRLREGYF